MRRPELTRSTRLRLLTLLATLTLVGCGSLTDSGKTSHHEVDHSLPDHWPHSLHDLAAQIRDRARRLTDGEGDDPMEAELSDLVGWTSQVAADTDLSEREWLPIYHTSESVLGNLRGSRGRWTEALLDQVIRLADLIESAAETLDSVVAGDEPTRSTFEPAESPDV